MIFATCGSSHFRFDRMMKALAILPAEELHVQHGPAEPPASAVAHDYLSFAEMLEKIALADVIISHAGVGSIICAIRAGHTPVIFPRLRRYSETVDDHQAELAQALAESGKAIVAWTAADLPRAVAAVPRRGAGGGAVSNELVEEVRAAIQGRASQLISSAR